MVRPSRSDFVTAIRIAVFFVIIPGIFCLKYCLVYNHTPSLPVGWYVIYPCKPKLNDLVLFGVPESIQKLVYDRGYLPNNVDLIKRVSAVNGDRVCVQSSIVTINGKRVAEALRKDREGRYMPRLDLCHTLGKGELFVLIPEHENSLDGRYFGVIREENLRGCGWKI